MPTWIFSSKSLWRPDDVCVEQTCPQVSRVIPYNAKLGRACAAKSNVAVTSAAS